MNIKRDSFAKNANAPLKNETPHSKVAPRSADKLSSLSPPSPFLPVQREVRKIRKELENGVPAGRETPVFERLNLKLKSNQFRLTHLTIDSEKGAVRYLPETIKRPAYLFVDSNLFTPLIADIYSRYSIESKGSARLTPRARAEMTGGLYIADDVKYELYKDFGYGKVPTGVVIVPVPREASFLDAFNFAMTVRHENAHHQGKGEFGARVAERELQNRYQFPNPSKDREIINSLKDLNRKGFYDDRSYAFAKREYDSTLSGGRKLLNKVLGRIKTEISAGISLLKDGKDFLQELLNPLSLERNLSLEATPVFLGQLVTLHSANSALSPVTRPIQEGKLSVMGVTVLSVPLNSIQNFFNSHIAPLNPFLEGRSSYVMGLIDPKKKVVVIPRDGEITNNSLPENIKGVSERCLILGLNELTKK